MYKVGIQFLSTVCEYPISPAPFVEETVFSQLCSPFVEIYLAKYVRVYFWALLH